MEYRPLTARRLAGALGAEIEGVDLAEPLDARWRWQPDDVAIWDERCTLHHALPDHSPQHRKMRRCTVDGDRPS